MTDDIDTKLARVSRRLQAERNAVTEELARVGLLGPVTQAREKFGAKLTWLRTDRIEVGREPEAGIVPAAYTPKRIDPITGRVKKG